MQKITTKHIIASWLWLLLLTFLSVTLGKLALHNSLFIVAILFIVTLKGQQIIDIFMELKFAPNKWRFLVISYIVIVPLLIALIYIW